MTGLSIGNALVTALTGYCVVFFGLVLLMIVITVMGRIMVSSREKAAKREAALAAAVTAAEETPEAEVKHIFAPGAAGRLKLYNTDPKDAAMIMAIVADSLGKPLNELRFISIREVEQ